MIRAVRLMEDLTASIHTGPSQRVRRRISDDGGRIAVEIGHTQRQDVGQVFAKAGYRLLTAHRDLAGSDRAMVFSF